MDWKLLRNSILLGTLSSLIVSATIFFGFPQLSNFNVEDYIFAFVAAIALLAAFQTYRRAAARKTLHAILVFFGVFVSTVFMFALPLLILIFICRFADCRIFPFL